MLENVRDRGNKKWAMAMMLPEHVEKLKDWHEEDNRTDKPQLDDWELEQIADEIERAFKGKGSIKLTYWRDGYLKKDYGKVIEIDLSRKTIVLDDPFTTTRYPFNEITAVQIID